MGLAASLRCFQDSISKKKSKLQSLCIRKRTAKFNYYLCYSPIERCFSNSPLSGLNSTECLSRTVILSRTEGRQFSFQSTETICGWKLGVTSVCLPSKRRINYSYKLSELYSSLDFLETENRAERKGRQLNYKTCLGSSAILLSQLRSTQEHDGSWTPRYFQGTTWQNGRTSHVT